MILVAEDLLPIEKLFYRFKIGQASYDPIS
jgi:hypothetical protein